MERKRTRSRVIFDDGEDEEGKDWKIREQKKSRYTENPENEEEESEEEKEEEEEDKENRDRRISPRKINRPIYNVDVFDDDDDDDDEDEDEDENDEEEGKQEEDRDNNKNGDKDEEDNERPGTSTKNTHNQGPCVYRFLPVTCGTKTGILDVNKLERGEKCIKSGGHWFSPSAFENFGGKGSAKKWKTSIFNEDKPLQFLFEQGILTTSGYKRKQHKTTEQPKLLSSNHTSPESSSEESVIHSAGETEEDDVEDEDWLPASEELLVETEKVKGGVENGEEIVDSGDDKREEEEDEMEKGEVEDEDVAAVADNDNSSFEERKAKLISSISEKSALLKKVEVVIKRLPEIECPSIIKGAEEENEKEFTQSNKIQDDGQREITETETGDTPTPLHPPATSSQDIKPKTEDIRSTSNHAANLSSSCVQFSAIDMKEAVDCGEKDEERTRRETGPETEGFDENSNNELVSMSSSQASDHPVATGDIEGAATSPTQRCVKEEGGDPPSESLNALVECKYEKTDATTFNNDAAQLQVELDSRVLQTTQTSDIAQTFVMVEVPSSTSCDLDTMDLDQLRREKMKMQIKVLRLQEQYYTRKINELKN